MAHTDRVGDYSFCSAAPAWTVSGLASSAASEAGFAPWLRSCLMYYIPEKELQTRNTRRLVLLSARDRFYGKNLAEKNIFLAINWRKDGQNIVTVRSGSGTWETSFAELSRTRPLELNNLFANNELWVEGVYPALVSA